MIELSEERLRRDLNELNRYGFCSTYIYKDFREIIDNQIKIDLVAIRRQCKANDIEDENYSDEKLFEIYQKFWALSEPSLQEFYEKLQKILAVPEDCIRNLEKIYFVALEYAQGCNLEAQKLEEECTNITEEYFLEKCFEEALKQRQKIMNGSFKLFAEKCNHALLNHQIYEQRSQKAIERFKSNHEKMLQIFNNHFENSREAAKNVLAQSRFVDIKANVELHKGFLESFENI